MNVDTFKIYLFIIEHLNKNFNLCFDIHKIKNCKNQKNTFEILSLINNLFFTFYEKRNFHIEYDQQKCMNFSSPTTLNIINFMMRSPENIFDKCFKDKDKEITEII